MIAGCYPDDAHGESWVTWDGLTPIKELVTEYMEDENLKLIEKIIKDELDGDASRFRIVFWFDN